MKIYFIFILILCYNSAFSQLVYKTPLISKSSDATIQNLKNAGISVIFFKDGDFAYGYEGFDNYGKFYAFFEIYNNQVKRVTYYCEDPVQSTKRFQDIYKTLTREDMKKLRTEFGEYISNYGQNHMELYTYSSTYYSGKAKYSYTNNYSAKNKSWLFTFQILD